MADVIKKISGVSDKDLKSFEVNRLAQLKTPILQETKKNTTEFKDVIASQGHDGVPGHYYQGLWEIELDHKMKLTEVNTEVMREAVEMQAKRLESAMSAEEKRLQIEFDMWQQELFIALDAEIGADKHATQMHAINIRDASVENNLRKLIIEEAQKNIRVELEEARRQFIPHKNMILDERARLISAQELTLQKRIQVIPLLDTIISKQSDLLSLENELIDRLESLVHYKLLSSKSDEEIAYKDLEAAYVRLHIANRYLELYTKQQTTAELRQQLVQKQNEILQLRQTFQSESFETIARRMLVSEKESEVIAAEIEVREKRALALEHEGLAVEKAGEILDIKSELTDDEVAVLAENKLYLNARDELIKKQYDLIDAKSEYLDAVNLELEKRKSIVALDQELATKESKRADARGVLLDAETDALASEYDLHNAKANRLAKENERISAQNLHISKLVELIPEREALALKREGVAEKTKEKAGETEKLSTSEKEDLIPEIKARLAKLKEYVKEQEQSLPDERKLIEYQVKRALLTKDRAESDAIIAAARISMLRSQNELDLTKLSISLAERLGTLLLESERAAQTMTTVSLSEQKVPEQYQNEEEARNADHNRVLYSEEKSAEARKDTATSYHDAAREVTSRKSASRIDLEKARHDFSVRSKVTTNLTHLLGSTQ